LIPTILIFDFGIILTVWYFSFFFVSCQYLHQVKKFKYCYLFHRKLYKKKGLTVACPWLVVLSGYSGILHH